MAESLVNLTSLKRRMSLDEESVGGPIDVAVISNPDFSYYPEIGVIVQFYESHQILGAHARQRIGRAKNRLFPSGHEPNSCSTLISDSNSGYRRAIASDV